MYIRRRPVDLDRVNRAVGELELPDAVFKTSPWQPRSLVAQGLRHWLRCTGAALRDDQVIGMPSHAVDEAWHGFILCTVQRIGVSGRTMIADERRMATSPGGHPGATLKSSAAGLTPTTSSSDKSLPGPASSHSTTPRSAA